MFQPDLEFLEGGALAMAQATIQGAIDESHLSRTEIARALGRPKSYISRILRGDHNLTIRTLARVLGVCGFEVSFQRRSIQPKATFSRWRQKQHNNS